MRAIGRVFFFAGLALAAGCTPDLARDSGVLAIRVVGLPREAATVRATVDNGSSLFRAEADVPSFDGELLAEDVPAGTVVLLVEATTPAAVLRREQVVAVKGPLTRVVVDFGGTATPGTDGGVVSDGGATDGGGCGVHEVASNPISHVVTGLRQQSVTESVLSGHVAASSTPAYRNFVSSATTRLCDAAPRAIEVSSVQIELVGGTAQQVSNLQNLWRDTVTVSFVPQGAGDAVVIASGAADGDTTTLSVSATRADLAPIVSALVAGTFDVRVSGATDRGRNEDTFYADVAVSIVYTAYDR